MARLTVILVCLLVCVAPVVNSHKNERYRVAGMVCGENEEVSCLIARCPAGHDCPAEQYCFDPECVCRFGYRRSNGICVEKKPKRKLQPETLEEATY